MRNMRNKVYKVFNNLRVCNIMQNGFNVRVLPEEPNFLTTCIDPDPLRDRIGNSALMHSSRNMCALLSSTQDVKRLHLWGVLAQLPEHYAA
jgi:hypothetical protein